MAKDLELEKSKKILSEKDEELRKMKSISHYKPQDIVQISGEENPIEVLKEIAVSNRLSPQMQSESNYEKKENKTVLNHPFYQNLSISQKENLENIETQAERKAAERYEKEQNSFNSLSSVSVHNEVSAATDMQYEELFDPSTGGTKKVKKSINNKGESYSSRRDTHKARKMMEKSREDQKNEILKQITPVKFNKNYDAAKSTNGKANPMSSNHGYSCQFEKRKKSRGYKARNKAKFMVNNADHNTFSYRSQSACSKVPKSTTSRKSSSSNRMVDLKEVRNQEKQKKQARIGIHGTHLDKMISKTNFSKMSK